jgi:hypothetical protein
VLIIDCYVNVSKIPSSYMVAYAINCQVVECIQYNYIFTIYNVSCKYFKFKVAQHNYDSIL